MLYLRSFIARIVCLGLLLGVIDAQAGFINFDDAPNGTVVNTRYPGVTFANPLGGNAYARDSAAFAPSTPNVVSIFGTGIPSFHAAFGAVDATFATPVSSASIDARPVAPPEFLTPLVRRPYLEAYSESGQLLGQVYYLGALPTTGGGIGPVETLSFTSASANIKRIRFSVQNPLGAPATSGLFDNLRFESEYSLAASATAGGSVSMSPSQPTYAPGTLVQLRATALPGWQFAGWTGDASGTGNPLTVLMDRNRTVEARFFQFPTTPAATYCANFDGGAMPGLTFFGDTQIDGGRLKLYTVGQTNSFGIAYIDDFNGGAPVSSFRATFKAALFGATCCLFGFTPADGFSFNLVPASTVRANPVYAEPGEEGLDEGLAINFDTWDNGAGEAPAIEIKWLGQMIAQAPIQASQSPNQITDVTAALRDVVINLDPDGTIDVSYGGVVVFTNVPTPYRASVIGAPKWVLGARVGAANDNHWFDDLCITASPGQSTCHDFNHGRPAGVRLFGNAEATGGQLKLYTVGQVGGYGIAYLEDFSGGHFVRGFQADFKATLFGSTCCGGGAFPADGFSFNLVPADTVRSNPAYGEPGEEGLAEGLAINFDTWDNGGAEGPAIEVKWLGQVIAQAPFQPSQSPAGIVDPAAASRDVRIRLDVDGTIDVSYGGTLLINNVATPYNPAVIGRPIWIFGARVGGADDNHWIDDVCISTVPVGTRPVPRIYNTGVDDFGAPLADNAVDQHYTATPAGSVVYAATQAGGFPIPPWLADSSASAWVSIATDTVAAGDTTGFFNYRYETTLDLTGLDHATVSLAGRWATDNAGVDILVNGVSTRQVNTAQFTSWTPFQITSGFVPGLNRIAFVVNNGSPSGVQANPTGLRVEFCNVLASNARLAIQRQGQGAVVSWSGTGFILQTATTPAGPWVDFSAGTSANGFNFSAALATADAARFLRLRQACD